MKWYAKKFLNIPLLAFCCASATADDFFLGKPAEDEESVAECANSEAGCEAKWDASVEFGWVSVSGNTDTDSLNGRFALSYEIEKWRHEGYLATQSSSSKDNVSGITTEARKLNSQVKSAYKFSPAAYAFGIADYDQTKDSGYDYQVSIAFGAGYSFIKNDNHTLDGELGFGSRESKEELTGETNRESISRIAGSYKWKINTNSEFEQKLSSEIGEDNTVTKSYTGLSANILENLAMKVSYTAKHQSEVPDSNKKTETVSSFTLVYSF